MNLSNAQLLSQSVSTSFNFIRELKSMEPVLAESILKPSNTCFWTNLRIQFDQFMMCGPEAMIQTERNSLDHEASWKHVRRIIL